MSKMSLQKAKLTDEEIAQFDWLNLQKDMDEALPQEDKWQKLIRKCSENPFVPIGIKHTITNNNIVNEFTFN